LNIKMKLICGALCVASVPSVYAEPWTGQGEAGLIKASGNTDSENANIGLNFKKEGDLLSHELAFGMYRASTENVDSAESINASYTLKYTLTERSYVFGSLSYLDDEFDGFTEQSSIAAGYGYKVIDTEPVGWDVGLGVGYRDTSELLKLEDGTEVEGKDLSGPTLVLRSDYRIQLTSNTEFVDKFVAEIGSDNSYIENSAALVVAMNDKFALKAGVLFRHNTDPAPGTDDTDTITSMNLVYNFK